ncbi:MAG: hypothetical protein Fur0010_21580 [Bdellovibrio sp.]
MKWLISLMVSFSVYGQSVECLGFGSERTFELSAELEESGSSYLDAFVDLKVFNQGVEVFNKKRIDSTGLFSIGTINSVQVFLAELRPLDRKSYTFLSMAINHPRPSGNSFLIYKDETYLAECFEK